MRSILHSLGVLVLVVVPGGAGAQDTLGVHHYAITTRHPGAQRWFDRGLRLAWDSNHSGAVRAFEEGERLDPGCAMCAWGIAFALGPTLDSGMKPAAADRAYAAIQRASRQAAGTSARERALIDALARRYASDPLVPRPRLDSAWAAAIGAVADRFPEDQEAQVLHADALMILATGRFWTATLAPRPGTELILQRLRAVLAVNPEHPGACRRYARVVSGISPSARPCLSL